MSCRSLAVLAVLALLPVAAGAHAFLVSAEPSVGGTVVRPPSRVVLEFTEGVEPSFSTITVEDRSGRRVDDGHVASVGDARHLAVGLETMPPGRYRVQWHAVSVDTHKTEGGFAFTVAP